MNLRKYAEQLASARKERISSVHLLAAIVSRGGAASDLLSERRLSESGLLLAGRSIPEGTENAVARALDRARGVASRMGLREPASAHVLIALLNEPRGAARLAVEQCGADVGRLRSAAMNLGLGLIGPRRRTARSERLGEPTRTNETQARKGAGAITVPLFPPRPVSRRVPKAAAPKADETAAAAAAPHRPETNRQNVLSAVPESPASAARMTGYELDPQKFPALTTLGKNLSLAAVRGELEPVVGRTREIEQALDVLAKCEGNNPCLVGPSGVGKTSVVRGIALAIAGNFGKHAAARPNARRKLGRAPLAHQIDDRIVIEIPVGELLAGTGVRGALASRISAIRKEVQSSGGRVVVFFDEMHQLFGADAAEELACELKLALAKGELPCIGATTREEYARVVDADPALARRFCPIEVLEPTREDAFLILAARAQKLEAYHSLRYSEEALAVSIAWSVRYLPGRVLPDKALAIIDLAGARARRRGACEVVPENVAEVVAELADMPVERLLESDRTRMLRLEQTLSERVVGHQDAVSRIARILRRNAVGLGSERPIGTFLLLGPTGVGKTETAKAVAELLFHSDAALTRFDFSEYSEPHSLARLIGSPPGYVGYEAGGQLTEAVRKRPYQVILLDEIEKAHPDVLTAFLAVFDEGRLTDGRGRTIDFTNSVIFMTSNLGAEETPANSRRKVGFGGASASDTAELERRVIAAARAALAPELYNRIDEVIFFAPLRREEVREVARRMLTTIARSLERAHGIGLQVDESAIELLLDAGGFDPTLGARPMRRALARLLEAPLAERILQGEIGNGDAVLVSADDDELSFDVVEGHSAGALYAITP